MIIVPEFVMDALEELSGRDPHIADVMARYARWRAHTQMNPALLGNIADHLKQVQDELGAALRVLRGDGPLQGGNPVRISDTKEAAFAAEKEWKGR